MLTRISHQVWWRKHGEACDIKAYESFDLSRLLKDYVSLRTGEAFFLFRPSLKRRIEEDFLFSKADRRSP